MLKQINKFHPNKVNRFDDEKEQDSQNYSCSKCNKNIIGLVNLMDHFNKDHDQVDSQWQCPICPKNFKDRIGVWRHVRSDHLSITKKCPECGISFPLRKLKHHKNKMHGKLYKVPFKYYVIKRDRPMGG